ncbi:hypothetical protein GmHk_08G023025 [Glycine max]|nr:hypothetical protein GmHk_08G023025 [Glycine max]
MQETKKNKGSIIIDFDIERGIKNEEYIVIQPKLSSTSETNTEKNDNMNGERSLTLPQTVMGE